MRNLLEMVYEYQLLRAKEEHLDIPLEDGERVRRMGLRRLLQGEVPDPQQRTFARVKLTMPVQFTRPGGFESGEIRDLGGGGFMILSPRSLEPGARIIVRVEDPRQGVEYVFPCVVRWRSRRGPKRMGVEIDGVPSRGDLYDDGSGVWRRTPTFGDAPADPMVA